MDPATNPGSVNPGGGNPPSGPPMMPASGHSPLHPGAPVPAPGQSAPPLTQPPAMTGADASWLPPTVPVKPGSVDQLMVPTPAVAEDGDVIEKEWVVKAKRIIAQTRQDPYKQTRELHKFRTEYVKKRYNKVIEPLE